MTTGSPKNVYVKLEATLFEVGAPLVVLLARNVGKGKQYFMATAIPDDDDQIDYYFSVYANTKTLKKYIDEQCDLRYVFEFAPSRQFYKIDNLEPGRDAKIKMVEYTGQVAENMLPDHRFFASAHTSKYGVGAIVGVDQRLLIDGNWDMQEFGSFYQRFSDLYSYEQAVQYINVDDQDNVQKVRSAFAKKPFKGGSSYTGFFTDLLEIIPYRERPALEGIEYHSPGHVDLRGKEEVLAAVKNQVETFLGNLNEIQAAHDNLRRFMSDAKLLSITGKSVVLDEDSLKEFTDLVQEFFQVLPVNGKQYLGDLTKGNQIVKAKVGLGLFRRLKSTAYFFAQGRLAYDDTSDRGSDEGAMTA